MDSTGRQKKRTGRTGSKGSGAVMELLLYLVKVNSFTLMSSSLPHLRLAESLAKSLFFLLGAITTETTEETKTTKTTEITETTNIQVIRRRERDDI